MANSLSSRCTMAPQSCNFLTARASCSYKIAQILHIAAVHLSGMLKSTGHFSMCPCFSVVHLIESTYLLFTSCNCLPLAYMGRVEAFQLMYIWSYRMHLCTYITATASLPAGEISHILSTCELCLWSPLHVKCKSRTSSFHCLCLHASERDIPVKAVKGKKPLLLVQGCSFFFICRGLCLFPGMAEDLQIMSGVFSPEMYRNYKNRHDHETFLCMLSVLWPASEYHHERLCANLHVLYACF